MSTELSRRGLVLGGLAAAGLASVAAACGSARDRSASTTTTLAPSAFALVTRFPTTPLFSAGDVRLPVCLGEPGTGAILRNVPTSLRGTIVDGDGVIVADFDTPVRDKGVQYPYFPIRAGIKTQGVYTIRAEIGGLAEASFQVFAPEQIPFAQLGAKLPGFDTPTMTDPRGVDPVCTREPSACPFHDHTLNDVMAEAAQAKEPFVYFIGTPAHCQVGTCAPGLDFLINAWQRLDSKIRIVHAEVYADDLASRLAPAVTAAKVDYEPIIYLCDSDATIVDRIDTIWDQSELDDALAKLLG